MLSDRIKWPEGKVCAAMITVNLEAQYFAKMYYPDEDINMKDGEIAVCGKEGMIYGLPKLLDVFDKYDIRPLAVKQVLANGVFPLHVVNDDIRKEFNSIKNELNVDDESLNKKYLDIRNDVFHYAII